MLNTNLSQDTFTQEGGKTDCKVRLEPDPSTQAELPLHIVFCIDCSGSMSGSKIAKAKEGIASALNKLGPNDEFSVVTFDNSAEVIVNATSGKRTGQAKRKLQTIEASGGTHIIRGLEKSRTLLEGENGTSLPLMDQGTSRLSKDMRVIKRVALVTDGKPANVASPLGSHVNIVSGIVDGGKVEKHAVVADALNDRGITINTAGVGSDYGGTILEALSFHSGGEWEHHSSANDISAFFKENIKAARSVVAVNPSVEFRPKNGVKVSEVYQSVPQIADLEYERDGDRYLIDSVPDIRIDMPPEFIFELEIPEYELNPDVEFADIVLDTQTDRFVNRISGQFVINEQLAIDHDTGDKSITREVETVREYLGQKDTMNQDKKEEQSRKIARKS